MSDQQSCVSHFVIHAESCHSHRLTAADFFDGSDDLQRQHFQRLNSDAGSSTHSLNRSSQNTPGSSSVSNVPNSNATSLVPRPGVS